MQGATVPLIALASLIMFGDAAMAPEEEAPRQRVIALGEKRLFVQVDFIDARTGFVVGGDRERGTPAGLMRTDDGGETWRTLETGVESRLYDVAWPTREIGIATGFAGCVIRTEDGGETWTALPGFENAWVPGVHFLDAQHGFIAGSQNGMLLARTEDGGTSWRSIIDRVPEEARSIDLRALHFVDEMVGIACGSDGLIIRTTDGGQTWSRCESGSDQAWLKSISFPTPAIGYIAGSHSVVLRTDDGGATWRNLPVPGLVKINGVAFISPERGIVAGAEGEMFYTTDGASSWHELPRMKMNLTNATASPNGVIWVTTEAGVVLRLNWPAADEVDDETAVSAQEERTSDK